MSAREKPTLHAEIRSLQRIQALLICIQHTANEGVEFDVADALLVIIELLDQAMVRVDELGVPA
jgi:hypothetical protein